MALGVLSAEGLLLFPNRAKLSQVVDNQLQFF